MILKLFIVLNFLLFTQSSTTTESNESENIKNTKYSNFKEKDTCESVILLIPTNHHSGYIQLPHKKDAHIFYMYFENRHKNPDAPLLFWTNGGPGSSSIFAVFKENGPYKINNDMTLCWNEYGWDTNYNILYVDQPIGTGYSYSTSISDTVYDEASLAEDMLYFFYEFFHLYPELAFKDLFLTGESFAGHFIPSIAYRILKAIGDGSLNVNLMGIMIGNPYVSPIENYESYPLYAAMNNLISEEIAMQMLESLPNCKGLFSLCDPSKWYSVKFLCTMSYFYCQVSLLDPILELNPTINKYDIRYKKVKESWYDLETVTEYLNLDRIKRQLNVKDDIEWAYTKNNIIEDMLWDKATDTTEAYSYFLQSNISIFIYNGDQDLVCNYISCESWLNKLQWPHQEKWINKSLINWYIDDEAVGAMKQIENLKYVRVYNAGHEVPMDQPKASFYMIKNFIHNAYNWHKKQNNI